MECIVCLYGCHGIFKFKYRKANQNESRPRIMKKRKKQLFSLFCITLAQVAVCVFMGAYVLVIGVLWGMCVRIVDCVGCMMCSTDCRMQCQQQHFLPFSSRRNRESPQFRQNQKAVCSSRIVSPSTTGWLQLDTFPAVCCDHVLLLPSSLLPCLNFN